MARSAERLDGYLERNLVRPVVEGVAHEKDARILIGLDVIGASIGRRRIDSDVKGAVAIRLDVPIPKSRDRRVQMTYPPIFSDEAVIDQETELNGTRTRSRDRSAHGGRQSL